METKKSGHECELCIFVANAESILVSKSVALKAKKKQYTPFFINFFTMPLWIGHAAFYAFHCIYCDCLAVDYPHGYTSFGYLFLTCHNCNINLVLDSPRYAEIYRKENMAPPKSVFRILWILVKQRFMLAKSALHKTKTKTPNLPPQ